MKTIILMYHRVDNRNIDILPYYANLRVSLKNFENQMKYLSKNYNVIPLQEFINGNTPKKSVILTFDDGYLDNYTNAYSILKKYNLPATFFVCPGLIDGKLTWKHKFYYLINKIDSKDILREFIKLIEDKLIRNVAVEEEDDPKFISEELQEILSLSDKKEEIVDEMLKTFDIHPKGNYFMSWNNLNQIEGISIGSHGMDHISLNDCEDLEYELGKSKEIISKKVKNYINALTYPFGHFDKRIADYVKTCYDSGLTTKPGLNKENGFELKRIAGINRNKFIFAKFIFASYLKLYPRIKIK